MRQQKWKQKPAMITASSPGRLSAPLLCAGAGSGRAAIHCVCVCVSLVSQHGWGRGSRGRELGTENREQREMCRDVANVMENAHWNRRRLQKAKGGH